MRVALYARKSVLSETGESVKNQIRMCRDYVASFLSPNAEIIEFCDDGYSAKDTNRPAFKAMMTSVKDFDFVVCYRLDRLSRNVVDFCTLAQTTDSLGVKLVCIREHFDTSTPMGRAMMYMASVFAQLERETIAQRVKDNMLLLAQNGQWMGGTSPVGYSAAKIEFSPSSDVKKTFTVLKCDENAYIPKMIFDTYSHLRSLSATYRDLEKKNIVSPHTKKPFSRQGIYSLLTNPVYSVADGDMYSWLSGIGCTIKPCLRSWDGHYGVSVYNRRNYSKHGAPKNIPSSWVVTVGFHSGIISSADWINVQNILRKG